MSGRIRTLLRDAFLIIDDRSHVPRILIVSVHTYTNCNQCQLLFHVRPHYSPDTYLIYQQCHITCTGSRYMCKNYYSTSLQRSAGCLDDEALQLTKNILSQNPEISTFWSYRREILEDKKKSL